MPALIYTCPACWPGRQAWELVLDDRFFTTLALVALPLVILALITGLIHVLLQRVDARD